MVSGTGRWNAMVTDRRMLAAPALAVPLIAGTVFAGMVLARRLKRAATTAILAFGQDTADVFYSASLAGDRDPWGRATSLPDGGTELRVANEDADVFFAASLAGDAHPYETTMGLPHLSR
jgi:hypothetical protein